jgi:hypothetical protein
VSSRGCAINGSLRFSLQSCSRLFSVLPLHTSTCTQYLLRLFPFLLSFFIYFPPTSLKLKRFARLGSAFVTQARFSVIWASFFYCLFLAVSFYSLTPIFIQNARLVYVCFHVMRALLWSCWFSWNSLLLYVVMQLESTDRSEFVWISGNRGVTPFLAVWLRRFIPRGLVTKRKCLISLPHPLANKLWCIWLLVIITLKLRRRQ